MKKLICLLLVVVMMATMLAACGKFECEVCGEEKSGKKYTEEILGREITYCQDCHDKGEDLKNLFK